MFGMRERAGTPARHVRRAGEAGGGDVAQRVGTVVAELSRVGRPADADGIHDEENCARHQDFSAPIRS